MSTISVMGTEGCECSGGFGLGVGMVKVWREGGGGDGGLRVDGVKGKIGFWG